MKSSQNKLIDIRSGSLWSGILAFSMPLIFSNILQVLFNVADVAVVGRFAGAMALGSVGSTTLIVALVIGFLQGFGAGVNSLVARYYGGDLQKEVRHTVHSSLIVSVSAGILVWLVCSFYSRPILELLNTRSELIDGAELYLKIYFTGMPALAVYNFGNGVLSAVGDTKKPLLFLLIGGVINVILNLIFVIGLKMDVAGVAAASSISQYVTSVLILAALFKSDDVFSVRLPELKADWHIVSVVLLLSLPAGFQNSVFGIANLFLQAAVNSFDAVMVSGNSAASNSDAIVYSVMGAFYVASTSFIAQNYGAGKKERVIRSYGISLFYCFASGAVLGGVLLIFGRQFLSLFTTDPAVIEAGLKRTVIMGFSYAFSAPMDCSIAASRGLGKTFVPTVVVIMGSCVFRIIWIYTVFAYFNTIPSLYLLYIFSWSITGIAEVAYFISVYRKTFNTPKIA